MQGEKDDFIRCKTVIVSFTDKLPQYKQNVGCREFGQFPTLMMKSASLADDTLLVISPAVYAPGHAQYWFTDLKQLHTHAWGLGPVSAEAESGHVSIQEDLNGMKHETDQWTPGTTAVRTTIGLVVGDNKSSVIYYCLLRARALHSWNAYAIPAWII